MSKQHVYILLECEPIEDADTGEINSFTRIVGVYASKVGASIAKERWETLMFGNLSTSFHIIKKSVSGTEMLTENVVLMHRGIKV